MLKSPLHFACSHPPHYCPYCGQPFGWNADSLRDFKAGAGHTCRCGAHFQIVTPAHLQTALDSTAADLNAQDFFN